MLLLEVHKPSSKYPSQAMRNERQLKEPILPITHSLAHVYTTIRIGSQGSY